MRQRAIPDFQGGLVFREYDPATRGTRIVRLDGTTGLRVMTATGAQIAGIHTDGTIFAVQTEECESMPCQLSVVAIDPISGTSKFTIPLEKSYNYYSGPLESIVAGDGYFYLAYEWEENRGFDPLSGQFCCIVSHLALLRADTNGNYDKIPIKDWSTTGPYGLAQGLEFGVGMITNADQGVLLTYYADSNVHSNVATPMVPNGGLQQQVRRPRLGGLTRGRRRSARLEQADPPAYGASPEVLESGIAITNGTSMSLTTGFVVSDQTGPVLPLLQAQDGSFVGTVGTGPALATTTQTSMIAFDATGSVRWSVPGYDPQIAIEGGIIATDASGVGNGVRSEWECDGAVG
jgi:hypothetical protein